LLLLLAATPSTAGETLDLERYEGQVVLLDFWASWCDPCVRSFPWMGEMLERYGDDGLVIVAVNLDDDPAAADRFLEDHTYAFEHLRDSEGAIAEKYGVRTMPSSILFDREGQPAFFHDGFRAEERSEYERHIAALLAGEVHGNAALLDPALRGKKKKKRGVRPWERDILAQADMLLDCDPLDLAIDDHIYFSKEASSGGRGFGGGGCGCN
jgi:thiol-disulfide isomerase/thioredoxin